MSRDIFVFAEQRGGKLQKVGCELLGEAARLAIELGEQVTAVLAGDNVASLADELTVFGAHRVVLVEDPALEPYMTEPYTKAVVSVVRAYDPSIVLFGATSIGRDLAPRVAARIHTGLTADCTNLAIDPENRLLLMTRPAFGGNIMATIVCRNYRPQMATIRPGVMPMPIPDERRTGEIIRHAVTFTPADRNVELVEIVRNQTKSVDITAAKVIVAGGRGVGGPEGYAMLQQLASALGGEVAASRVGVDRGWIGKTRQVGQTGKTVRPVVYIACGISGAIQHLAGMQNSGTIIAINKDPDAPIMAEADLAVTGDLREIVPKLLQAVERYKVEETSGCAR